MTTRNAASMGSYGATWEFNGYAGQGNVGELIGTLKGRVALVAGSGEGVFVEMRTAISMLHEPPVIFACNDVGMFLPHVDHYVSLHAQNLGAWKQVRWLHPRERDNTKYHSVESYPYLDYVWQQLTPCFALSGYFAMQIAYIMDADRIILCGCPGDATRRFCDLFPRKDFTYAADGVRIQLEHEMKRLPDFKKRVCSMSGWTEEYFGGL